MARSPKDILKDILADPTNAEHVASLCTRDVTYVSLNFSDTELRKVMPWAGTWEGPEAIVKTFVDVHRYWEKHELEELALFGDDRFAALFGRMQYRSTVLGKEVTSPFCIYIEVIDGLCRHMQFMEDTFATTGSFKASGEWLIKSNPNGEEVRV